MRYKPEVISVAMIALAAKFNNHDLQATSSAPGKTWYHSFTKGATESVIEGEFFNWSKGNGNTAVSFGGFKGHLVF